MLARKNECCQEHFNIAVAFRNIQIGKNTIWAIRRRVLNWFWRSSEFCDMQWKCFLILAFFINRDIEFAIRYGNLHYESQATIHGHLMTRCLLQCFESNKNKFRWVNVSIKDRLIKIYHLVFEWWQLRNASKWIFDMFFANSVHEIYYFLKIQHIYWNTGKLYLISKSNWIMK